MARRGRRRRASPRVRRIYARARGGGGALKPIIDGFLAGAAGGLATKYLGAYGHPVATLGIGYFRNNAVLKTEGARELGATLVSQFVGNGIGTNAGGGFN